MDMIENTISDVPVGIPIIPINSFSHHPVVGKH